MSSHLPLSSTRTGLVGIVCALLLPTGAPPALPQQSISPTTALEKILSLAETQHEIVMLLINKKEFGPAATEAAKIFEMKWPADHEPILLKEILYFADQFLHQDQAPLGLQLLDTSLKHFKTKASQIAIWKEKGYLYKQTNQKDKALDCFREAQRLEKTR